MSTQSKKERRDRVIKNVSKEILPKFSKKKTKKTHINLEIQEAGRIPNKMNAKKSMNCKLKTKGNH